jgi:hypothetical protein
MGGIGYMYYGLEGQSSRVRQFLMGNLEKFKSRCNAFQRNYNINSGNYEGLIK